MTEATSRFKLGLNAGPVGRWTRLIIGAVIPLVSIVRQLLDAPADPRFYLETGEYFAVIFGLYLLAHAALGERLLARANPWIGTLILVGPPTAALVLGVGPASFQFGLALYISVSLVFNFVMSYGGCEVMAIPSLIFGRRYTVYCPYNVVDVVDKVMADRNAAPATRHDPNAN